MADGYKRGAAAREEDAAKPGVALSVTEVELERLLTALLKRGFASKQAADPDHIRVMDLQLQVNRHILLHNRSVLHIAATGSGKTEAYLLAAAWMRRPDDRAKMVKVSGKPVGPIIVFEPFRALVNDQLQRAKEFGLEAYAFRSVKDEGKGAQDEIIKKLRSNTVDVLFLTADMMMKAVGKAEHKLNNIPQFGRRFRAQMLDKWACPGLVVLDEIHMVEKAGANFIGGWKQLWPEVQNYPWFRDPPKLGLTATFPDSVQMAVFSSIGGADTWTQVRGPLLRKNITISVKPGKYGTKSRQQFIFEYIMADGKQEENVLVYVQFKKECEEYMTAINTFAQQTDTPPIAIDCYHADLPAARRKQIEDSFRSGAIRVLIATEAIGTGFDKRDIHTVIHTFTPANVVDYYQQIGRAGRDVSAVPEAFAILLPTVPWYKDGWVNALAEMVTFLRCMPRAGYRAKRSYLENFLDTKFVRKTDAEEAFAEGYAYKILVPEDAQDVDTIVTVPSSPAEWMAVQTSLAIIRKAKDGRTQNVKLMRTLYSVSECCWSVVLRGLDQEVDDAWECTRCTFCRPDGDGDVELRVDPYAGTNICYTAMTPLGHKAYALREEKGASDFDGDRIRRLFAKVIPDMQVSPSCWSVVGVPSSKEDAAVNTQYVADALQLTLYAPFTLRPGVNKSRREVKSVSDINHPSLMEIFSKFVISGDDADYPKFGGVLLVDDNITTGSTVDFLARVLVAKGLEVAVLADEYYKTLNFQEVNLADDDDAAAPVVELAEELRHFVADAIQPDSKIEAVVAKSKSVEEFKQKDAAPLSVSAAVCVAAETVYKKKAKKVEKERIEQDNADKVEMQLLEEGKEKKARKLPLAEQAAPRAKAAAVEIDSDDELASVKAKPSPSKGTKRKEHSESEDSGSESDDQAPHRPKKGQKVSEDKKKAGHKEKVVLSPVHKMDE
jgi:superfamily II DNA or RNA helicase